MVKLKKEDRKKSPLNRGGRGDFREATFPGGIIGHPAGGGIDGGSLIGPLDSRCSYAGNFQFPTDRCRRRESRYLVTALGFMESPLSLFLRMLWDHELVRFMERAWRMSGSLPLESL